MPRYVQVLDFDGKTYRSFASMCRAFGKTSATVKDRLKFAWSLREALLIPPLNRGFDPSLVPVDLVDTYKQLYTQFCLGHIRNPEELNASLAWSHQRAPKIKDRAELSERVKSIASTMAKEFLQNPQRCNFPLHGDNRNFDAYEAIVFRAVVCSKGRHHYLFKGLETPLILINNDFFDDYDGRDFYKALKAISVHGLESKCKTPNGIFVFLRSAQEIFKDFDERKYPEYFEQDDDDDGQTA